MVRRDISVPFLGAHQITVSAPIRAKMARSDYGWSRIEPTLLEGCVDGDYGRAGTRGTVAGGLYGEIISASISSLRCVYIRRYVEPLQRAVCRILRNARTQYFAGNINGKHAAPAGGDLDIAYRVKAPACRRRSRHHALRSALGKRGHRCNCRCQCGHNQYCTRSYQLCHSGAPLTRCIKHGPTNFDVARTGPTSGAARARKETLDRSAT
jgi:hypothetical protein